jgi:hypothetical protein
MNYLHVSKPLVPSINAAGQHCMAVTTQPGTTYCLPDGARRAARKDRREGFTTARQQRKDKKAWRDEQRYEAKLNAEIANNEANLDWQDDMEEERAYHRDNRTFDEMNA